MSDLMAFVDRIEGSMAVLLLGAEAYRVVVPADLLPPETKEGTVLKLTIAVDDDAGQAAKKRVQDLMDRLERGGE